MVAITLRKLVGREKPPLYMTVCVRLHADPLAVVPEDKRKVLEARMVKSQVCDYGPLRFLPCRVSKIRLLQIHTGLRYRGRDHGWLWK